jgi:hypothetical protein
MLTLACTLMLAAQPAPLERRWVALDAVALRQDGDAKSKKLEELRLGDVVELLGEHSSAESTQRLRCREVTAAWLKVKHGELVGWVFGGALDSQPVDPGPASWRAVIAVSRDSTLTDEQAESDDSAFFDEDIQQQCQAAGNPMVWVDSTKPCAVIGDPKQPLSVIDLSDSLSSGKARWFLIERKDARRTVKALEYGLETHEAAMKFCGKRVTPKRTRSTGKRE